MRDLLVTLALIALVGLSYWLGWDDRDCKAAEDAAFAKLDALIEKVKHG